MFIRFVNVYVFSSLSKVRKFFALTPPLRPSLPRNAPLSPRRSRTADRRVPKFSLAHGSIFSYTVRMGMIQAFIKQPLLLLYMLPALLMSLTVHEWGHAFAAYRCGDPTARNMGRMTLNPFAHIDWVGFLCLMLFGFGWAKPVPVNPRNFRNYRRDEILVSLAGVAMNFVLLLISFLLLRLGVQYLGLGNNEAFCSIIYYFIMFNACLMVFNLIPIPPLDGSHIFEVLLGRYLPAKFLLFMRRYGYFILLALILGTSWLGLSSPISAFSNWVLDLAVQFALL